MMTKALSDVTPKEFSELVSTGVMRAFAEHDSLARQNAEHEAMLKQHAKVTGQDRVNDPITQVAQNLEKINENNDDMKALLREMASSFSSMVTTSEFSGRDSLPQSPFVAQVNSSMDQSMKVSPDLSGVQQGLGGAFARYSSYGSSVSPQASMSPDMAAMNQPVTLMEPNSEASDKKTLKDAEDSAYKASVKSIMPKLDMAIDKFLERERIGSGTYGESSLMDLIGAVGGGMMGFALGYVSKLGEMWKGVGSTIRGVFSDTLTAIKDSKFGKTIAGWKKNLVSAFDSGIAKLGELKTSFGKMFDGWIKSFKDSAVGRVLGSATDMVKNAGKTIAEVASKAKNGITKAMETAKSAVHNISAVAKKAGSVIAKTPLAHTAMSVASQGMKLARKVPVVQAAGGLVDTAVNTYGVIKNGGSVSDALNTGAAGLVDTLSDTLLIPELVNGIGSAVSAAREGKGFGGVAKGFGTGFMKQRDANEISIGTGLVSNLQNLIGNGTETTRRVASAYNRGYGYDAAGVERVTGSAAGFGHSAALYKPVPMAAGSMVNNKTPNATMATDEISGAQMSEADRMKLYADSIKEGVKEAMLSSEVQEANMRTARETGAAINGQLFGG